MNYIHYFGQPYDLCVYFQDTTKHLILVSPRDNFETPTYIALPSDGQCEGLSFARFKVAVVIGGSIYQFCLSDKNGGKWGLDKLPPVIPVPQKKKIDILWDPESQNPYLLDAEISTLQEYLTMVQRNDLLLVTKPNEVQLIRWPGHDRSSTVFSINPDQFPLVKSFWAGDFLDDSTIAILTTSQNDFSGEDSFEFTVVEIRPSTPDGWEYLCTFLNTCVSNATEENANFKTVTLVGGALPAAVIWNPGSETIGIVARFGGIWETVEIIYAVVDEDADILQMTTITGLCGIPDSQGTTINRIAVTQDDGKLHLIKTDLSKKSIVPEELQYGELPILTTPAEILGQHKPPDTLWKRTQHKDGDDFLSSSNEKDRIDDEDISDQALLSESDHYFDDNFAKTADPESPPPLSPAQSFPLSPAQSFPLSPAQSFPLSPAQPFPLSPAQPFPLPPTQPFPLPPAQPFPLPPTQPFPLKPVPEPKTMPETSPQKSAAGSPQANDESSIRLTTVAVQKKAVDRDVSSYAIFESPQPNPETSREFSSEQNGVGHPSSTAQEEELTGLLDNRKLDIVEALDVADRARRNLKLVETNAETLAEDEAAEERKRLGDEQTENDKLTDGGNSSDMRRELEDSLKPWDERLKSIVEEISEMAGSSELDSVRSVQDETVGILEDCQTSLGMVNFQLVANRVKDLQTRVDSTARIIGRVAAAYDRVFSLKVTPCQNLFQMDQALSALRYNLGTEILEKIPSVEKLIIDFQDAINRAARFQADFEKKWMKFNSSTVAEKNLEIAKSKRNRFALADAVALEEYSSVPMPPKPQGYQWTELLKATDLVEDLESKVQEILSSYLEWESSDKSIIKNESLPTWSASAISDSEKSRIILDLDEAYRELTILRRRKADELISQFQG